MDFGRHQRVIFFKLRFISINKLKDTLSSFSFFPPGFPDSANFSSFAWQLYHDMPTRISRKDGGQTEKLRMPWSTLAFRLAGDRRCSRRKSPQSFDAASREIGNEWLTLADLRRKNYTLISYTDFLVHKF